MVYSKNVLGAIIIGSYIVYNYSMLICRYVTLQLLPHFLLYFLKYQEYFLKKLFVYKLNIILFEKQLFILIFLKVWNTDIQNQNVKKISRVGKTFLILMWAKYDVYTIHNVKWIEKNLINHTWD